MPEPPKKGDKGGPSTGDLAPASLIAVLEDLLASLRDKAQPLFDQIRAIEQVLENAKDNQFLEERRQERAFERQIARETQVTSPEGREATAMSGETMLQTVYARDKAAEAAGKTKEDRPPGRGAPRRTQGRVRRRQRGGTKA